MYLDAGEGDIRRFKRSFGCFSVLQNWGLKLPLALSFPESNFTIKWFAYHKITETSYNIPSFPTQVKGFLGETSIFWVSNVTDSQRLKHLFRQGITDVLYLGMKQGSSDLLGFVSLDTE